MVDNVLAALRAGMVLEAVVMLVLAFVLATGLAFKHRPLPHRLFQAGICLLTVALLTLAVCT